MKVKITHDNFLVDTFLVSYTSNALIDMVEIQFSRDQKNFPKMCLKINWSVKTP